MKKNVQKRLVTVAKMLTLAEDEKSLWRKFFTNKDKTAPAAEPEKKLTPEEVLKQLDDHVENVGYIPTDKSNLKPKNPLKTYPVLQDKGIKIDPKATKDFAAFLSGRGSVPFELSGPLKQIGDALAASGTISVKDSSNVIMFLSKMLRKYLAGQKLAKVATSARRARVAASTPEYLKKYLLVSE